MNNNPLHQLKHKRGSQLPQSKLCEDDVQMILQLVLARDDLRRQMMCLTNRAIADKFGVSHKTIQKIAAGDIWAHVSMIK